MATEITRSHGARFALPALIIASLVLVMESQLRTLPASRLASPTRPTASDHRAISRNERDGGWLASVERHLSEREYWAGRSERGLQAPNRAQRLRTYFDASGIRVVDRSDADSTPLLAMRLARFGRGDELSPLAAGTLTSERQRVEIRRDGLVEWFDNSPAGIEHGFDVGARPAGEGPLVFELDVEHADALQEDDGIVFAAQRGRRLAYRKLAAFDAGGRALDTSFAISEAKDVRIVVADSGARYPIHVDPLLSGAPDATIVSGQPYAYLGTSAAGAGDVNRDGYDDVIVGAPSYDAGQADEGAAFVFLGSAGGLVGTTPAAAHAQLESNQVSAGFGLSAAGAGDVNGDGYDDVLVGTGARVFVFHGGPAGIADGTPATARTQLDSDPSGRIGGSVAGAGDVDGDGYDDVIVGASTQGAAFVFLGGSNGIGDGTPEGAHAKLESGQGSFGFSVAGAGDVNGDGCDDVIVGAPSYSAGQSAEGAAFIFLGSPQGMANGTPATAYAQLESDQANAQLGSSVAGAGDVNGDGRDDVIVGAQYYDSGQTDEGAAFVFLGSSSEIGYGTPADADAQFESNRAYAELGRSVAGAGDVNGDGFDDVVVAETQLVAFGRYGSVAIFLGSPVGVRDGTPDTAYAQLESDRLSASFGHTVASAGDVNGDGYADVLVAAATWAPPCCTYDGFQGAAFVFMGSGDGTPALAHAYLHSTQAGARFGEVASAGDVNGDGYDDVIVGARYYDAGQANEGAAFVFLGGAARIADGTPATADAQLESNQVGADFGDSVAGAGDVNGDGYDDVIVGARLYDAGTPDEGAAFVFLGGAAGIADGTPANAHTQLETNQYQAELTQVSSAGDVNGDGYDDVIVGAKKYDAGQGDEGAAFVFLGSGAGVADGTPATAHAQFEANQPYALLGSDVARAGDVDHDGYDDVIVGASNYTAMRMREGAAFVFRGSAAGIADGTPTTADALVRSDHGGAEFGESVAGAGDVNGDGYDDVIVGAPADGFDQAAEGAAFVFLGGASGLVGTTPATAHAQLESNQAGAELGWSVAGAGDMNGDGYDDVIVGAYRYDVGQTDEGAAFVFLGGAAGIADGAPSTGYWQLESDQAGGWLGWSVAGAGDVNGDGLGDVIVGAPTYDSPAIDEGAAFIFLGRPSCGNGRDDDRDGLFDHPNDPGCTSASDTTEASGVAACSNGLDDDGDGRIDFDGGASRNGGVPLAPSDPACAGQSGRDSEQPSSCGLGTELVLLFPVLALWRRRTRRRPGLFP